MKLLVSILSRQTVVQKAVVKEAAPDSILFFSTRMSAGNGWYERIPMLVEKAPDFQISYTNIFLPEISVEDMIKAVKRHIHRQLEKYPITEIYFDASSGKGIHRIAVFSYLKSLSEKRGLDFFLVYFDNDTRAINKMFICGSTFSQYKSNVSIDWELEDRVTIHGARLADYLTILKGGESFFSESYSQFDELYSNLCSSLILRSFFSSYESIKNLVDVRKDLNEFILKNHVEEQVDKFVQRLFGVMPHLRKDIIEARGEIKSMLVEFFNNMISEKVFLTPTNSYRFKQSRNEFHKRYLNRFTDTILKKIEPFALIPDKEELKNDIYLFMEVLFDKVADRISTLSDVRNIKYPEAVFNRFNEKYVAEIESESTLNTRSKISVIFEKLVSFAVYRAIVANPVLRESIASVFQNVQLDGKTSSLVEIDTLVMFRNGYIHVFEAKSSHASNKDINSKMLVMKKYLGESVGMDIVFPFTAEDIEKLKEKDRQYIKKMYSKGLRNVNTWANFFSGTDKSVTPIDKIEERLVDMVLKYS